MAEKAQEPQFIKVFTEMEKDEEGYVSKRLFLDTLMKKVGLKKRESMNYGIKMNITLKQINRVVQYLLD